MKNNKDTTQTLGELLHDLQALVTEAETMIADSATGHAADAVDSLRLRFVAARDRAADAYAEARKKVIAGAEYTDETIRANPYQSLAVAAGAGLLVGLLLGRRRK